jgi:methyltransferase (TIGR00027 family)
MQNSSTIQNVSDTALWIAAYRAQETETKDAAFKDHLARKLAGARGFEMIADTPHTEAMAFAMTVRTVAIDRLITSAIAGGVDTIVNLGAGLDTRPYRMAISPQLKWIEADFPSIIDYKNEVLADDHPNCNLQRLAVDLSKDDERKKLFQQIDLQAKKALVITEGVIGYLTNELAADLSKDLFSTPSFQYWIMDYAQGPMRKRKQTKDLYKKLVHSPIVFDHAKPLLFFQQHGWKLCENRYILDESDSIGKKLPLDFPLNVLMKLLPGPLRKLGNETYGYCLFCKG